MDDSKLPAEQQFVVGAQLSDLNYNLIREHIESAVKRRKFEGPTDPDEYLKFHKCARETSDGTLVPTLAGIVAFGREPHMHLSCCGIDIVQFKSTRPSSDNIVLSQQIRGDLVTLIDRAVDFLWASTKHGTKLIGTERVEDHAYPLVVLRELTVNAIVHRDWHHTGTRVRIQMFPDHIEWVSPGGFPGPKYAGITFETLLRAQFSRNMAIAQILYYAGRIEAFGLGLDTVAQAVRESGGKQPEVIDTDTAFTICVWGKTLSTESRPPSADLTERQTRIIDEIMSRGRCTTRQLADLLEADTRTIQRDLKLLMDKELITAEGATTNRIYRPRSEGTL